MEKNLVIYYSIGGTTEETAKKFKAVGRGNVDLYDVKSSQSIDISKYDKFYIGSGVYGSNLPEELSTFVNKNKKYINEKKTILFLHALGSENKYMDIVRRVFGSILDVNKCEVYYLGGKADTGKQILFIRLLIKRLAKKKNLDLLHPNNIDKKNMEKLMQTI